MGMTIDLSACTGCGTCTVACQAENNIAIVGKAQVRKGREMHWIRIDRYFSFGRTTLGFDELNDSNTEVVHQPVGCQHRETPLRERLPGRRDVHSTDGLNDMVYTTAVSARGTALEQLPVEGASLQLPRLGDVELPSRRDARSRQAALQSRRHRAFSRCHRKCTYCVQRIRGAQRIHN